MDTIDELFDKVSETIKERTIETLEFDLSIYRKRIILIINKIPYDISSSIPENIWNIGGIYKKPREDWEIRVFIVQKVREFVDKFDPNFQKNNTIYG